MLTNQTEHVSTQAQSKNNKSEKDEYISENDDINYIKELFNALDIEIPDSKDKIVDKKKDNEELPEGKKEVEQATEVKEETNEVKEEAKEVKEEAKEVKEEEKEVKEEKEDKEEVEEDKDDESIGDNKSDKTNYSDLLDVRDEEYIKINKEYENDIKKYSGNGEFKDIDFYDHSITEDTLFDYWLPKANMFPFNPEEEYSDTSYWHIKIASMNDDSFYDESITTTHVDVPLTFIYKFLSTANPMPAVVKKIETLDQAKKLWAKIRSPPYTIKNAWYSSNETQTIKQLADESKIMKVTIKKVLEKLDGVSRIKEDILKHG